MKLLTKLSLLFVIAFSILSCAKEEVKPEAATEEVPEVYVKDGVLVIKDWNVAYGFLEDFENNGPEFTDAWEENLGFTSMRSTYNNFLLEEEVMINKITDLYNQDPSQVTEASVNSEYANLLSSYENSIIPFELEDAEGKYYDMNLYHTIYAPIVNENGIVCIEGELYRYTSTDSRKMVKTDWSQLSELFNDKSSVVKITKVDKSNAKKLQDPVVDPIDDPEDPNECTPKTYKNETYWDWSKSVTETSQNKYRLKVTASFDQHDYTITYSDCSQKRYTKTHAHVRVKSLIRVWTLFGTWQNYKVPIGISYNLHYKENGETKKVQLAIDDYDLVGSYHTYTKTLLYKTTYSNHPSITYFVFKAYMLTSSGGIFLPAVGVSY